MLQKGRFPLYIVSKGRWESRLTVKHLEKMGCSYRVVIEKQEYGNYSSVIDKKNLLVLDESFKDKYNTCDDLGFQRSKGSGPARNFAWEHSISEGHKYHWVMDDNIRGFYRVHNNRKILVESGVVFTVMEDFILRYENIVMGGPHYHFFIPRKEPRNKPFIFNTRVFSCNFIRNDIPFRWRGRWNEDAILSLDILKAGYCTVQFYAITQAKAATQTMKGGNMEDIYKDGTFLKSKLLVKTHPDVCRMAYRYGRWHHHIDMSRFKYNRPIRKKGLTIAQGVNNYGMRLLEK